MEEKIRGIYISCEDNLEILKRPFEKLSGVEKKIVEQFRTLKSFGYDVCFFNSYRQITIKKIRNCNFIYIRKSNYTSLSMILFLRKTRKINKNMKIILEIPTYPYDLEYKKNKLPTNSNDFLERTKFKVKNTLKIKVDRIFRFFLKYYVDRIVTYSLDKSVFGIKTINLVNAIDFERVKRIRLMKKNMGRIGVICVASLDYWHGYDRAIEGLRIFRDKHKRNIFKLYIVGNGPELSRYKKMIDDYDLNDDVILTGFKGGKDLENLYEKCVIGLDSLGRHRSGIFYNSSLKGKEYCAKGLIIVSGVKTELDNDENYKYYMRIPANDSPVNFESVFDLYKRLTKNENLFIIQKNIIEYAKNNFSYNKTMEPIIRYIKNVSFCNNKGR